MTIDAKTRRSLPVYDELRSKLDPESQQWMLELARWYESDWALAVESGEAPSAEQVLDIIEPHRRHSLESVLESIRRRYEPEFEAHESTRKAIAQETLVLPVSDAGAPASSPAPTDSRDDANTISARPVANAGPELASSATDEVTSEYQTPVSFIRSDPRLDVTLESADIVESNVDQPAQENEPTIEHQTPPRENVSDNDISFGAPVNSEEASRSKRSIEASLPGYRIQKVLGRGGMGVVYLAVQQGIERLVALKMILGGLHIQGSMLQRFHAEARAIGRFQHENIVRIYDSGTHEGLPYFALEFIEGSDLSKRIHGEPMPAQESARLAEQICRGMQYSHERGVIHRDLKPANILLTSDDVPKITDFGLAKEFTEDAGLSRTGTVVGTPAYMAPEQALAEPDVGPQADVYGIGAILYCMLTGRPPFQSTKATDTLVQVINNEPVEPKQLQPGVSKDLETICMKALQKERTKRYTTAAEMGEDLVRFLRDEPIHARPVSKSERVYRWCRRNPRVAIASGLASALGILLLIGGPTTAVVINGQKKTVVAEKMRADENAATALANEQVANEAKQQAVANADAAQTQEKLAIDALKSVTFEVQQRMKGDTRLHGLRESLIGTVRTGLARMEKQGKDVNAHNMIAAGIAARKGDLNMEVGRINEAEKEYVACLETFQRLKKADALPYPEQNLSKIHFLIASAARKAGKLELADEHFAKSLAIRRNWLTSGDAVKVLPLLAEVLGSYGSLSQERGDLPKARKLLDETLQIHQQLHKKNPKGGGHYTDVMTTKMSLAKVQFQSGDTEGGLRLMTEAATGMQQYSNWNPNNRHAQVNAALFDGVRARMLLYVGRADEAASIYAKSVERIRNAAETEPNSLPFHEALDRTLYGYGVALTEQTDMESNTKDVIDAAFSEIVAIRKRLLRLEPTNTARGVSIVGALARAGEIEDGIRRADEIRDQVDEDATILYHLACGYAQLAGKIPEDDPRYQRLVESAIDALESASRAGFHRQTDLRMDPDLDPIRGHAMFVDFVNASESH